MIWRVARSAVEVIFEEALRSVELPQFQGFTPTHVEGLKAGKSVYQTY